MVRSGTYHMVNESPAELDREIQLVDGIKLFLADNGMQFVDAAPYLALAFRKNLSAGNELDVIVPDDSHPGPAGYAAYADAAADLLKSLQ